MFDGDESDAILCLLDMQRRYQIRMHWIPHPLLSIFSDDSEFVTLSQHLETQPELLNRVVEDGTHGPISLLHVFCSRNWKDRVRHLLESGANPHMFDDNCPLLRVCRSQLMQEIMLEGIERYANHSSHLAA